MNSLNFIGRSGSKAFFKTEGGELYSVNISHENGVLGNGLGPSNATFEVNPELWQMAVSGNLMTQAFPHKTTSLNPDGQAALEAMFRRLEDAPEVTYFGSLADLTPETEIGNVE